MWLPVLVAAVNAMGIVPSFLDENSNERFMALNQVAALLRIWRTMAATCDLALQVVIQWI